MAPSYEKLVKLIKKLKSSKFYDVKIKRDGARVCRRDMTGTPVFKISVKRGMDYDISLKTIFKNRFVRLTGDFNADFVKDPVELSSNINFQGSPKYVYFGDEQVWDIHTEVLNDVANEAEMVLKKAIELEKEGQYFISGWQPYAIKRIPINHSLRL